MPRIAGQNSCLTCRRRRLKCDGSLPTCMRCAKRNLHCDRTSRLEVKEYNVKAPAETSIHKTPQQLLTDRHTADLFQLYIRELASWYDLNDEDRAFALTAANCAIENSLLLSSMVAFAGVFAARRKSSSMRIAEMYHSRCLGLLIKLNENDAAARDGTALAATCLLRSYEILSEDQDPGRHLFGASTLVPAPPELSDHSLLASGFWNYLREDITYSLIHGRPLKFHIDHVSGLPMRDDEMANAMTLLLARTINFYQGRSGDDTSSDIDAWKQQSQMVPFARFEELPFPVIHMLKDCQVAALHYYHVSKCMLEPENAMYHAIEICGLSMTAKSAAVLVNSYGPIAFSGQWLTDEAKRRQLVRWLRDTQASTSWPVESLIGHLEAKWLAMKDQAGYIDSSQL